MYCPKVEYTVPISVKVNCGYDNDTGQEKYEEIPGAGGPLIFWANWKGAFGQEVYAAYAGNAQEVATVTMRYHPAIKADSIICVHERDGSVSEFDIIGVPDNIGRENKWLEFKVRRRENG